MSRIHFIGGEKGGVGKSVVARLLCQYCIDRGLPFAAVDADTSHGALLRYYGSYTHAVDLTALQSADAIMDRALGAERQVIVDLPAQSARSLRAWMESGAVLSFAEEMGVSLSLWHVTDGGFDSVSELQRAMDSFGPQLEYVVVKNAGRSPDFSQLEESEAIARLRDLGGRELELPALYGGTMYKIDRQGSSFWAAIHSDEPELRLTAMERQRTKLWLAECYLQLDTMMAPHPEGS
jgi:hypothetical protein